MKKLSVLLLVLVVLLSLAFAGCEALPFLNPSEPATVTGIEIASNPAKVTYKEGDVFDASGLVVKKVMSDGAKSIVADYTISKTTELATTDTEIVITWNEFSASIAITVESVVPPVVTITGLQFKTSEGYVYQRTQPFGENLMYRTTKSDGSFGEWDTLVNNDITDIVIDGATMTVNVQMTLQNKTLTGSFTVACQSENTVGVAEFLAKDINDKTTVYNLDGIVIGISSVIRTTSIAEYYIKDKNSDAVVSILGLLNGDDKTNFYNGTLQPDFAVGDEVVLPVTIAESGITREPTKIIAKYAGGTFYRTAFVSADNSTVLSKENVTVITNQEELAQFLNADNRPNNYYKFVKLSGDLYHVAYNTTAGGRFSRFFFDDSIKANAQQYIDSSSPVFLDSNTKYCAGTGFIDLVLGGVAPSDSYDTPSHSAKDIYALYAGSNTYYHQFVILHTEDVSEPTKVSKFTYTAPAKVTYALGDALDFAGGKVEEVCNYKQFNKTTTLDQTLVTASTYDNTKAGNYTVTFTVDGAQYTWNVAVVASAPVSIALKQMPAKTTYTHREGLANVDVAGGILMVTYEGGSTQNIELTKDMLQKTESPDWKVGVVNYTINYNGLTTTLPITYENTAYTVSEFYDASHTGEMDVTGIVMCATSSCQTAELILKDKTTGELMSIQSIKKLVGTYNVVELDTTKCKVGDEIIIKITKLSNTSGNNAGFSQGKGIGTDGADSYNSIIVVSGGNNATFDFSKAVTIASQQDLVNFLASSDRFLSVVKFTSDLKGVHGDGRLRIFFGECASLDAQRINTISPMIYYPGGINVESHFTGLAASKDTFTAVGTTNCEIYALYIRCYSTMHTFAVMDSSWIIQPV